MKVLKLICLVLLVIGGLNWGLVGLFNFNAVDVIFGMGSLWARIIYILVGVAALLKIYSTCFCCKSCER